MAQTEGSSVPSEDVQGHFELKSIIFSLATPFMLKSIVQLGIPDILVAESRPLSLQQILSQIPNANSKTQPDLLERILQYLVHKGVLSENIEDGTAYYGLNSISKGLASNDQMHNLLLICTHDYAIAAYQKVQEAVVNGGYAYQIANNCHVWDHNPGQGDDYVDILNNASVAWSSVTINLVLQHYDGFKNVKKLVDVGGGLGMCMGKVVEKYPQIEGVNFDLPYTISTAPPIPGVTHVGGNMFESVPSADTLLLKSILINFSDNDCLKTLANCNKALPQGGKLIVIELIHAKDGSFEFDLDIMMIGFSDGGKTRKFEEHVALLEKTGFGKISLVKVPSKEQVIEAYKL